MKNWTSLFYSQISTGATAVLAMVIPRKSTLEGIQLSCNGTAGATVFTSIFVGLTDLSVGWPNGSPILAWLNDSNAVSTAVGVAYNSSGLYVPQQLPLVGGQFLYLHVVSTGASTSGICILQLSY